LYHHSFRHIPRSLRPGVATYLNPPFGPGLGLPPLSLGASRPFAGFGAAAASGGAGALAAVGSTAAPNPSSVNVLPVTAGDPAGTTPGSNFLDNHFNYGSVTTPSGGIVAY